MIYYATCDIWSEICNEESKNHERMNEMESDERMNEIESYVFKSWIAYITLHIKISVIYHKYKTDREDTIYIVLEWFKLKIWAFEGILYKP